MLTSRSLQIIWIFLIFLLAEAHADSFLDQKDDRGIPLESFIVKSMSKHISMNGSNASYQLDRGLDGANLTVFEMDGFTMKPVIRSLSYADSLNGVELQFYLSLKCKAYRQRPAGKMIFSDWRDGLPPPLGLTAEFRFEKRDGGFQFRPLTQLNEIRHQERSWKEQIWEIRKP